jgi:hypothetical protein
MQFNYLVSEAWFVSKLRSHCWVLTKWLSSVRVMVYTTVFKLLLSLTFWVIFNYYLIQFFEIIIYFVWFILSLKKIESRLMLESYTSGTTDRQLWHKRVWIWPSSLQQSTAGESNTTYQIWSHISWLKEMNHQLKRTKLGRDQDQSFFHRNGCGQAWSHHLSARSDSSLCPDSARTQESLVPGKWPESRSPRKTRSFNSR